MDGFNSCSHDCSGFADSSVQSAMNMPFSSIHSGQADCWSISWFFFLVNIMSFELMQMIRSICQTFGLRAWGLGLLHLISFAGPSLKLVWPFMPVCLLCP